MKRREFITLIGGAAAWPIAARAQQPTPKLPRIGVLVAASPPHPFADAFQRGLRTFGYTEGKNVTIQFHYTDVRGDRAMEFAAELVRSNVDIIVARFTGAVRAAMTATHTIPIVMAPAGAPLEWASSPAWSGLAETLLAYRPWMLNLEANAFSSFAS